MPMPPKCQNKSALVDKEICDKDRRRGFSFSPGHLSGDTAPSGNTAYITTAFKEGYVPFDDDLLRMNGVVIVGIAPVEHAGPAWRY